MIEIDTSELREYLAGIEAFTGDVPDVVDGIGRKAAQMVVDSAKPTVPVLTGAARGSVRVEDFGGSAAAVGGRPSVPYYAWLEFGGAAGRNHSVVRPRVPRGRYLHPALVRERGAIQIMMGVELIGALGEAGLA